MSKIFLLYTKVSNEMTISLAEITHVKETSFEEITFEIQLIQVLPTGPEKTFEHCPDPESPSEDEVIVNIALHRICHQSVKAERTYRKKFHFTFHLPSSEK